jgi:hypothetical protein
MGQVRLGSVKWEARYSEQSSLEDVFWFGSLIFGYFDRKEGVDGERGVRLKYRRDGDLLSEVNPKRGAIFVLANSQDD